MARPKGSQNKFKPPAQIIPNGLIERCEQWRDGWKKVGTYEDIQNLLENTINATVCGVLDKGIANSIVYQAQLQLIAIDRIRQHSNPGAELGDDAIKFAEGMTVEQGHRLLKATTAQMQVNILNTFAREKQKLEDEQNGVVDVESVKIDKTDSFQNKTSQLIKMIKHKNEKPLQPENVDAMVEDDDLAEF